jgi:hypothetical protein
MTKTSSRPIIRIHDLATNEVIDREMNDAEFAELEANQALNAIAKAKAQEKETARADLLAKLGITAEEAKLLLS